MLEFFPVATLVLNWMIKGVIADVNPEWPPIKSSEQKMFSPERIRGTLISESVHFVITLLGLSREDGKSFGEILSTLYITGVLHLSKVWRDCTLLIKYYPGDKLLYVGPTALSANIGTGCWGA